MFQYRVDEQVFDGDTLKIFNGLVKATKEEIEITAIKRDCYKHNPQRMRLETYLKSAAMKDILILIDAFPSTVFPTSCDGEWFVAIESKQHSNLTDLILNHVEMEKNKNMDILSLIYDIISSLLCFSNFYNLDDDNACYHYERLMPQNIFISEHDHR